MSNYTIENHQGFFLKNYVIKNSLNKKGRLKPLIETLDISRQAFYNLYEQQIIKPKHRKIIVKHFNASKPFFPKIENPESKELARLKRRCAMLEKKVKSLQNEKKQASHF